MGSRHQIPAGREGEQLLDSKSGVEPYGASLSSQEVGERDDLFDLIHGVASAQGYVHAGVKQAGCKGGDIYLIATTEIVRLRVVATGAIVAASGKIDGDPESRAVDCRCLDYIEYSHLCSY